MITQSTIDCINDYINHQSYATKIDLKTCNTKRITIIMAAEYSKQSPLKNYIIGYATFTHEKNEKIIKFFYNKKQKKIDMTCHLKPVTTYKIMYLKTTDTKLSAEEAEEFRELEQLLQQYN